LLQDGNRLQLILAIFADCSKIGVRVSVVSRRHVLQEYILYFRKWEIWLNILQKYNIYFQNPDFIKNIMHFCSTIVQIRIKQKNKLHICSKIGALQAKCQTNCILAAESTPFKQDN